MRPAGSRKRAAGSRKRKAVSRKRTASTADILAAVDTLTATPPIIVCGMPRSGTTLMRELLRSTGRIAIFDEYSPQVVTGFLPFLEETKRLMHHDGWRKVKKREIAPRINGLMLQSWKAASKPENRLTDNAVRFGVKTPYAELDHARLAALLEELSPVYIYTMRNPTDVYRSILRMPWGNRRPKEAYERWVASLTAARGIDSLFAFDVDRSEDVAYRQKWAKRVIPALLGELPDSTNRFVEEWPAVNRSAGSWEGDLSDQEVNERVEKFEALREARPRLDDLYQDVLNRA